jgi:hypothetical protein
MKKRFAIPLAILIGLVFLFVVLGIIGSKMAPSQRRQQAEPPETANESVQPPESEPQQTAAPEPEPPQLVTQTRSDNILMNAALIEAPVVNGFVEKIGTRAYITLPQEILLEVVTMDDVTEFYRSFQGKGYNWVSIICPEGTGLIFQGAGPMASYGKVDYSGRLDGDTHWIIIYDETIETFRELEF